MTDKKKWVARSWIHADSKTEAEKLESILNELAEESYVVYQLDMERRIVVAYYREQEPKSLLSTLFDGVTSPTTVMSVTPTRPSSEEDYEPKGSLTPDLVDRLTSIMVARQRGDVHTKNHVCRLVKMLFGKASRHEVECSLLDVQTYHKLHLKNRSDSGHAECSDNCSTHSVLEITEAVLKEHLSSNPAS